MESAIQIQILDEVIYVSLCNDLICPWDVTYLSFIEPDYTTFLYLIQELNSSLQCN